MTTNLTLGPAQIKQAFEAQDQLSLDLTDKEVSTLTRCEAVIEEGRAAFLRVGSALLTIRDERLYRNTHTSFEAYLSERWQMGKANAYRLMEAVQVVQTLEDSPIGDSLYLPVNESQARPLSALPREKQPEAWNKAVEEAGGQPTAVQVKAVVDEMLPVKPATEEVPAVPGDFLEPVRVGDVIRWSDDGKEYYVSRIFPNRGLIQFDCNPMPRPSLSREGTRPEVYFTEIHYEDNRCLSGNSEFFFVAHIPDEDTNPVIPSLIANAHAVPAPVQASATTKAPVPVIVPARVQYPEAPAASLLWASAIEREDFEAHLPALKRVRNHLDLSRSTLTNKSVISRALAVLALNVLLEGRSYHARDAIKLLGLSLDADLLLDATTPNYQAWEMLAELPESTLVALALECTLREEIDYSNEPEALMWLDKMNKPVAAPEPITKPELHVEQGFYLEPNPYFSCRDCGAKDVGASWVDATGDETYKADINGDWVCLDCQQKRKEEVTPIVQEELAVGDRVTVTLGGKTEVGTICDIKHYAGQIMAKVDFDFTFPHLVRVDRLTRFEAPAPAESPEAAPAEDPEVDWTYQEPDPKHNLCLSCGTAKATVNGAYCEWCATPAQITDSSRAAIGAN